MKTPTPQVTLTPALLAIFATRSSERLAKDIEVEERMMKRRKKPTQNEVDFLQAMKLVLNYRFMLML